MSVLRLLKIALFGGIGLALFMAPPGVYFFLSYYRALDQEVVTHFAGKRWNLPSRIYSDSLNIYRGQNLKDLGLFERLARLNYHRVEPGGVTARGQYSIDRKRGQLVLFLHSFAYPYRHYGGELAELELSKDETIVVIKEPGTARTVDSIELEPELISGIFEGIWEQRHLVRLSQMPPALVDAILAAEDHRFYQHGGIDPVRISKALWVDVWSGSWRQGGSTLTQQLMKNFFLTRQRSWKRKVKEALMSVIAEQRFSKEEILENYINDIYLGQRGQEGIFGVWEASEYYFTKEPRDLTIGEMATIAGIIRSPNRLNPLKHPERARSRRNEVLALMLEHGYISKAAYDQAVSEPLMPREVYTETNDAPFFVDYVKKELAERYPPDVLTAEGLRIFTTLDVHLEKLAERAIRENLAALEAKYSNLRRRTERERLESCLVALEPQTGRIRAMAGGRNYQGSQFNRIVQSKRQPGSLFKPVTYLSAFEASLDGSEVKFTPTSFIEDLPFTWNYATDMSWTPNNYKGKYFGRVMLEVALGKSLNSATSRLAYAVGLERVLAMAKRLGFGDLPPYPSIVLGAIEASPMQIAEAYSIIADYGLKVKPYAVTAVVDQNGKVIEGLQLQAEQVLSPEVAYEMIHMLQYAINHGSGAGARSRGFRRIAAGKTGTTNSEVDAWFAGFTPDLLAVVWTGFDQKERLGLSGSQASLPAWTEFMKAATASRAELDFTVPAGVIVAKIDPINGYRAGPYCPVTAQGVFLKGTEPTQICPLHKSPVASISANGAERISEDHVEEPTD